jgi:hypothetical protein
MRIVYIGFAAGFVLVVCVTAFANLRGGGEFLGGILSLVTAETGPGSTVQEDWYPIVSKVGGVACRFPSEPQAEFTNLGEAYDWNSGLGDHLQMSWTNVPELVDPDDDEMAEELFAKCQSAFTKKVESGPLVSSNDFRFSPGVPTRDLVLRIPQSRLFRMRMMLTRGRIHVVIAVGNQEFIEGEKAEAFFESVRFLDVRPSGDRKIALWPEGSRPAAGERPVETAGADSQGGAADRPGPYRSVSEAGGFTCILPGEPKVLESDDEGAHLWFDADPDLAMGVCWKKLPIRLDTSDEQAVNNVFAALEKDLRARFPDFRPVSSGRYVFQGRYPARTVDFSVHQDGTGFYRARWILSPDCGFSLSAASSTESGRWEETEAFFGSFQFLADR